LAQLCIRLQSFELEVLIFSLFFFYFVTKYITFIDCKSLSEVNAVLLAANGLKKISYIYLTETNNVNIRTCPHCNYKYSIPEYKKQIPIMFRPLEWNCKNCNKKITLNFKRRVIVGLAFIGLFVILYAIKNTTGMTHPIWAVLLIICTIGAIFISAFDSFKKAE
jgi:hypothetical protein